MRHSEATDMTRFDLRQLELFAAVMEHSTITKAAEKMHLSPGAISLQLRDLASQLNADLFVKSGRRLAPTPDALRLAELVAPLLRQVREIEQQFESDALNDERPFRFACGATTLVQALREPLRRLRAKFPRATIQITAGNTEDMVAGLLDRRYDLAIVTLPFPTVDLEIVPLFEEELLIVSPSSSPARAWRTKNIQSAALASVPFLLHSERSNMRTIINGFFESIGVKPNIVAEADDVQVLRLLVESGFGYSVLPQMGLQRKPLFFQTYRVPGHRILRTQALAMPSTERPRPLTKLIADFLSKELAGIPKRLTPAGPKRSARS